MYIGKECRGERESVRTRKQEEENSLLKKILGRQPPIVEAVAMATTWQLGTAAMALDYGGQLCGRRKRKTGKALFHGKSSIYLVLIGWKNISPRIRKRRKRREFRNLTSLLARSRSQMAPWKFKIPWVHLRDFTGS